MFRNNKATLFLRNATELATFIVNFPALPYWAPCNRRPVYIHSLTIPFSMMVLLGSRCSGCNCYFILILPLQARLSGSLQSLELTTSKLFVQVLVRLPA